MNGKETMVCFQEQITKLKDTGKSQVSLRYYREL